MIPDIVRVFFSSWQADSYHLWSYLYVDTINNILQVVLSAQRRYLVRSGTPSVRPDSSSSRDERLCGHVATD